MTNPLDGLVHTVDGRKISLDDGKQVEDDAAETDAQGKQKPKPDQWAIDAKKK